MDFYKRGLSSEEANNKLKEYGPNALPETQRKSIIITFLKQFCDPLIYLLLFGAVFSMFLKEFSDGIFIAVILTINAIIGAIQEISADKSANSLKNMVKSKIVVIRDGEEKEIDSELLVPQDIVILKEGTRVPADIVLLSSENLEVNESMLTGESIAVKKDANYIQKENASIQEKFNEIFAGTTIVKGIAFGEVKATGLKTEMGKIADKLVEKTDAETPLTIRMEKFTKSLTIGIGVGIVFILIAAILRGESIKETIMMSISLCVAAVPESLPIATTIVLAVGTSKMAKHNVIVRHLSAVESLGSCTVIASDKTGTLTKNEMTVEKVIDINGNELDLDKDKKIIKHIGLLKEKDDKNFNNKYDDYLKLLFLSMTLPNEGKHNPDGYFGDAVDIAFLKFVNNNGYNVNDIIKNYPNVKMLYYTSANMCSASVNKVDEKLLTFVKGAPEKVLSLCKKNNSVFNIFKKTIDYTHIYEKLEELADNGYRVLAVAYKDSEAKDIENFGLDSLNDLNFMGLIAMIDPLKNEVKDSIKECQEAGINIVMITGDNPKTAYNIGRELNFVNSQDEVKTGLQVRETLNNGESYLDKMGEKTKVYSRMEPTQKLDIVQSLIRNGNFVAVTGDGVNDAPALKNANVGVAMGKGGTDIAKESADIILMDDNFASIVYAVKAGRITYNNIRKLIFFAISSGIPKIIFFIATIFMGLPIPFNAIQLLWLNVMTEGVQDIFLGFEEEEGGEMKQKPRDPQEPIFNKRMKSRCGLFIGFIAILSTIVYYYCINMLHFSAMKSTTIMLTLLVFIQNMQVLNARSETRSLFTHSFAKNKKILFGIFIVVLIHLFAVSNSFMNKVLKIEALNLKEIAILLVIASSMIILSEIEKFFYRNKK